MQPKEHIKQFFFTLLLYSQLQGDGKIQSGGRGNEIDRVLKVMLLQIKQATEEFFMIEKEVGRLI